MSQKVIMLVEDNPMDEELTLRALKKANILNPVVVARDGVEALDYLLARGAHANGPPPALPQVILLDLKLPKVDGLEVLRALRANAATKFLPVVILTSSREDEDLLRSYSLGANAYVRKPMEFAEFVQAAHTLGLFWLLWNEPPPRRPGP